MNVVGVALRTRTSPLHSARPSPPRPEWLQLSRTEIHFQANLSTSRATQPLSKRMVKQQQMGWSQRGAHLLLQIRTRVLNEEWENTFRSWYPAFRPKVGAEISNAACPPRIFRSPTRTGKHESGNPRRPSPATSLPSPVRHALKTTSSASYFVDRTRLERRKPSRELPSSFINERNRPLTLAYRSSSNCDGLLSYFSIAIFILRKYTSDPSD